MEVGGTAPGLPGPEALEVLWSSSSSDESPVYATKPVLNLFTAGSERGRTRRREEEVADLGEREKERDMGGERERENTKTAAAAKCFI